MSKRHIQYAIIVLAFFLILLGVFLVRDYRSLRRMQVLHALERHEPLSVNDIGVVRPWMTFDYVNKLFGVPPDYLKARLTISDARYPRLSLSGYAKYEHLDSTVLVDQVASALRDYLTTSGN